MLVGGRQVAEASTKLDDFLEYAPYNPYPQASTLVSEPAPAGAPRPKFTTFVEDEVGYQIDLPTGWVMEVPGGKREFHGPGDYKGKRVTVEVEPLGKLDPPSFNSLATPQEFAEQIADQVRKANQGANATVSKAGERDQGRVYAYEYRIDSLEPQLVWGVAGVGLGQNESARKFKLRQRVLVTCKVPEKDVKESDKQVLEQIAASFRFVEGQ